MLNRAMAAAGHRNGYDDVTAEFSAFRDFKMKWTRTYNWISFEVSDYLRNAPENVIQSLAETIFAKIRGEDRTMYSEEVCEYLNSEKFLKDNQNLYLRRLKGISQTPSGQNVDLMESYLRLIDKGYTERNPNLVIRWGAPNSRDNRIGHTSVLMKTVVMNPKLDNEDVEENVLDYALYTQICHTNLRFSPNREEDAKRYELMLADYPDGEKTRLKLAEMGIGL